MRTRKQQVAFDQLCQAEIRIGDEQAVYAIECGGEFTVANIEQRANQHGLGRGDLSRNGRWCDAHRPGVRRTGSDDGHQRLYERLAGARLKAALRAAH